LIEKAISSITIDFTGLSEYLIVTPEFKTRLTIKYVIPTRKGGP